jgi:hypothetical protein
MEIIWYSNDNIIEVTGVKNKVSDTYINNASVTVTLIDYATGAQVSGETWPLALSNVPLSNGDYRATLVDSLSLSTIKRYLAKVTVDGGTDLKGYWEINVLAKIRDS